MGKNNDKSKALGDDPLAWLNAGADVSKKTAKKKTASKKKKTSKKPVAKTKPKSADKTAKPETDDAGKSSNRIELESSLVINKASKIFESLKKFDASGKTIEIDASKVEIIDSAILQLLFAFVLSLKEKNIKWSWYKPTESLLNKASILGLTERLGL